MKLSKNFTKKIKAQTLIETIFSMVIVSICITAAAMAFFTITSYHDRIADVTLKQKLRNEVLLDNDIRYYDTFYELKDSLNGHTVYFKWDSNYEK